MNLSLPFLLSTFNKRDRALEVGCGDGYKSYWLSLLFRKYYAVDIDQSKIDSARKNRPTHLKHLKFLQGSIHEVPKEGVFDAVIFINSFHFMRFDVTISEIALKLAPKGVCLIVEPLPIPHKWRDDRLNKSSSKFDKKLWQKKESRLLRTKEKLLCIGFRLQQVSDADVYIFDKASSLTPEDVTQCKHPQHVLCLLPHRDRAQS